MSDIIYTPPASGGGGTTINPTDNFIPVRSNATTFIDSVLENGSNYLYSNYGGFTGLGLDFLNFVSYLGDWNNLINGTTLVVNDQTSNIFTKYNGLANGFNLDFVASFYSFGDIGTNSQFVIDSIGQYANIQIVGINYFIADKINDYVQIGNGAALVYCNSSANSVEIGDISGSNNTTIFNVDDNNGQIVSRISGNDKGILIDFANTRYYFGDFNSFDKGTHIFIHDSAQAIRFYTQILDFNGTALQSSSSSGASGDYLIITLNGTQYKIALDNF